MAGCRPRYRPSLIELEKRCVPAMAVLTPGPMTVNGISIPRPPNATSLLPYLAQATNVNSAGPYLVGDGRVPAPPRQLQTIEAETIFQQIAPTREQRLMALDMVTVPGFTTTSIASGQGLSDNSLVIRDYAVFANGFGLRRPQWPAWQIGQSMWVEYVPHGSDPTTGIHWIQFTTTNYSSDPTVTGIETKVDVPDPGDGGTNAPRGSVESLFYDQRNSAGQQRGMNDTPSRASRSNDTTFWLADLFLVTKREFNGVPDVKFWGGFRWGWHNANVRRAALATSTTVVASNGSPDTGSLIALTANVTDADNVAVPAGVIEFFDGGAFLGRATVAYGQATLSGIVLIGGGTHSIEAKYVDNDEFSLSEGSTEVAVNSAPAASDDAGATGLTSMSVSPYYQVAPAIVDVLANDSDANAGHVVGNPTIVAGPSHGSVVAINGADGNIQFEYTPYKSYTPVNYVPDRDSFIYTVDDGHGGVSAATAFINYGELPHPVMSLSSARFDEGAPAGTVVGTLSMNGGELNETFNYSLVSGVNSGFTIVGNELRTTRVFDYETLNDNRFEVTLRAIGSGSSKRQSKYLIKVDNVNEMPTNIALLGSSIAEGDYDRFVGYLSATDADPNEAFSFELLSADAPFRLVGDQLWTTGHLDSALHPSYTLSFRVTDGGGLTYTKNLTVDVTNLAPSLNGIGTFGVQANETLSRFVFALDPGQSQDFLYSLSGNVPNGAAVDAVTGELTWIPTTNGSYTFNVVVTDSAGLTDTKPVTIIVGTAPQITSASEGGFVLADAGDFTITTTGSPAPAIVLIGDLPEGLSFADNNDGTATISGTPPTGTEGNYYLEFTADNGVGGMVTQSFTLIVHSAPHVVSITLNGNIASLAGNQHSRVVSLVVVFDQAVEMGADALTLALHTNNVSYNGVSYANGYGTLPTSLNLATTDYITWIVTFVGNTDNGVDGYNSLKDGVYDLLFDASMIHPLGVPQIQMASDAMFVFHRLFGDKDAAGTPAGGTVGVDFQGILNSGDNLVFQSTLNNPSNYLAYFDFHGDGTVNTGDNLQFQNRFNKALIWRV
jgi:hypothetical protein